MKSTKDALRLISAGLFVFAGMIGVIVLLSFSFSDFPWWMAIAIVPLFGVLVVGAAMLFNWSKRLPRMTISTADRIRQLEQENLLATASYSATRAFEVEEFEDEGLHYFLGLREGGVLYLTGQYLYEYEPARGQDLLRKFPCTEFRLCWHKENGFTVGIECSGAPLEPEIVAPAFDLENLKDTALWEDRKIFTDRSYDQIKAERMKLA